jgi:hypothetical protein
MGTIIGRQYTPQDSNGNRDTIHPETQIDAVLDPISGVPLRDQLSDITEQLVALNEETNTPGFMTPDMKKQYDKMAQNTIVTDSVKPTLSAGGYWFNIYDPSTSEVDSE